MREMRKNLTASSVLCCRPIQNANSSIQPLNVWSRGAEVRVPMWVPIGADFWGICVAGAPTLSVGNTKVIRYACTASVSGG